LSEQSAAPPGRRRRRRIAAVAVIAAVVVAADQITKSLAVADLASHDVHVIGPFSFRLAYNTGVAFSVGTGLTGPIIIVAVALVLAIGWMARGVPTTAAAIAFGLIIGGALGNLSDRLFRGHHGGVVDFIYTSFWPTFNVADSCIVIGCFCLAVAFMRQGRSLQHVHGPGSTAGGSITSGAPAPGIGPVPGAGSGPGPGDPA
jgi:signal peptidase II